MSWKRIESSSSPPRSNQYCKFSAETSADAASGATFGTTCSGAPEPSSTRTAEVAVAPSAYSRVAVAARSAGAV